MERFLLWAQHLRDTALNDPMATGLI